MKRKVVVKAVLICQKFLISRDLSTFLSNQIYVLQLGLLNCETVAGKGFLLVNTRILEINPVIKASNHNANCVVSKRSFLLWV